MTPKLTKITTQISHRRSNENSNNVGRISNRNTELNVREVNQLPNEEAKQRIAKERDAGKQANVNLPTSHPTHTFHHRHTHTKRHDTEFEVYNIQKNTEAKEDIMRESKIEFTDKVNREPLPKFTNSTKNNNKIMIYKIALRQSLRNKGNDLTVSYNIIYPTVKVKTVQLGIKMTRKRSNMLISHDQVEYGMSQSNSINIKRSIFQRDSFSLLFCMTLVLLSNELNNTKYGLQDV